MFCNSIVSGFEVQLANNKTAKRKSNLIKKGFGKYTEFVNKFNLNLEWFLVNLRITIYLNLIFFLKSEKLKNLSITKTTNPIHFEDLNHVRFEDLCFNILHREKKWYNLNHLGKSGNDGGIDIEGIEVNNDKKATKWLIQCKRYKSISPSEIEKIIYELVNKNKNYKYIHLIVSCSFSRKALEKLELLKNTLNLNEILTWTNSNLEAKLYHEYPDLLKIYFGINIGTTFDNKLKQILKRQEYRDLLREQVFVPFDPSKPPIGSHRFCYRKFIIKSIMHNEHLESFEDSFGWSSYFSVQPYDIDDYGIHVNISSTIGEINANGKFQKSINVEDYKRIFLINRGFIPYEKILSIDVNNYNEGRPIFYCLYKGKLGPFEKISQEIQKIIPH